MRGSGTLEATIGKHIASFESRRYLVVGASPIYATLEILKNSKHVTMIDIRQQKIDKVAAMDGFSDVEFVLVREGEEFAAFDDGSFDCVVFYDVLHHFPEKKRVIAETRRILGDSGYAFFSEPNISSKVRREYDQFGVLKDSLYKASFVSLLSRHMFDVQIHTLKDFLPNHRIGSSLRHHLRTVMQRLSVDPIFRIYMTAKPSR